MGYSSDAQRKAVHASMQPGDTGAPVKQMGNVDPMTGMQMPMQMPMQPQQQMQQPAMTNVPQQLSNTMCGSKPLFGENTQAIAQKIYGSVEDRQDSVNAPPLFKMDANYNGIPGVQPEDFKQFE